MLESNQTRKAGVAMTSSNAIEITSEQAFDILHLPENQMQFFSGSYAKRDGTIRTFNGRRKVTKHLRGGRVEVCPLYQRERNILG